MNHLPWILDTITTPTSILRRGCCAHSRTPVTTCLLSARDGLEYHQTTPAPSHSRGQRPQRIRTSFAPYCAPPPGGAVAPWTMALSVTHGGRALFAGTSDAGSHFWEASRAPSHSSIPFFLCFGHGSPDNRKFRRRFGSRNPGRPTVHSRRVACSLAPGERGDIRSLRWSRRFPG